jgi:hypothetical protein
VTDVNAKGGNCMTVGEPERGIVGLVTVEIDLLPTTGNIRRV